MWENYKLIDFCTENFFTGKKYICKPTYKFMSLHSSHMPESLILLSFFFWSRKRSFVCVFGWDVQPPGPYVLNPVFMITFSFVPLIYGLAQLVRFLVVKLTHICSNPKFNIGVIFEANYSFSGRRHPRRRWGALGNRLHESKDQASSVFRMYS
jgi:hypothetical protein